MNHYHNWTVSELEQEARRQGNELANALIGKIKEIEESLALMTDMEDKDCIREVEYIKLTLNLENNW
jgi:hypothetical protein